MSGADAAPAHGLAGRRWRLDWSASTVPAEGEPAVTLLIEDGVVSGAAPCNRYTGPIATTADGAVRIGPLARTLMLCDPARMSAEDAVLDALQAVGHFEVDAGADTLVLWNDRGVRLGFRALVASQALIGAWAITAVATDDALESPLAATEPTLAFAPDGSVAVRTGCNLGSARWRAEGDRISVGPVGLTRRYCAEPAGVMGQEAAIAAALVAAARVDVAGSQLTLLAADGRIALIAAAVEPDARPDP